MRTYICRACEETITVGYPASEFKRKASALARESAPLASRLFRPGKTRRRYMDALVEQHYLQAHCYREVPVACPRCGHRGINELSWWRPGLDIGG